MKQRISFCPVCRRLVYFEIQRTINLFVCSFCGYHGKGTMSVQTLVKLEHQIKVRR